MHATMESAILREKDIKKWCRVQKIHVIEQRNPMWIDLWPEINGDVAFYVPDNDEIR
jgi:putative endonuclease